MRGRHWARGDRVGSPPRTDVPDQLDLDARVLELLSACHLDVHLAMSRRGVTPFLPLWVPVGWTGAAQTVPHTLSTALKRNCSTSFSLTLVVTVRRVSASANVTLNLAGDPPRSDERDTAWWKDAHAHNQRRNKTDKMGVPSVW